MSVDFLTNTALRMFLMYTDLAAACE